MSKNGKNSFSKHNKYRLIDEDTDEDSGYNNIIDDFSTDEDTHDIRNSKKFVGDQAEVDAQVSPLVTDEVDVNVDDDVPGIDLQNSESRSDEETDDVGSLEDFIDDADADDDYDSNPEDSDDDFWSLHL